MSTSSSLLLLSAGEPVTHALLARMLAPVCTRFAATSNTKPYHQTVASIINSMQCTYRIHYMNIHQCAVAPQHSACWILRGNMAHKSPPHLVRNPAQSHRCRRRRRRRRRLCNGVSVHAACERVNNTTCILYWTLMWFNTANGATNFRCHVHTFVWCKR